METTFHQNADYICAGDEDCLGLAHRGLVSSKCFLTDVVQPSVFQKKWTEFLLSFVSIPTFLVVALLLESSLELVYRHVSLKCPAFLTGALSFSLFSKDLHHTSFTLKISAAKSRKRALWMNANATLR